MVGNLGRVSTFGLNESNLTNILQTQRNITELSAQITSGKVARRYEGLAKDANRLVNIENELERTLQYRANSEDVKRRLDEMESGLAAIIKMGIELRADLVLASNPGNAENTPLAEKGRAFYEQTAAFLNAEQDNRYLFGGSKTDRPPVSGIDDVTAAFREAQLNGAGLDYANLAGKDTVVADNDQNAGVPLRALQIIDFFLNDGEAGTINTAYPVRSTQGYVGGAAEQDFRANTNAVSFSSFYYQGNNQKLSSMLEDNLDLEYGATADQKGLEKVLLAGWLLSETNSPTPVDGPRRLTMNGAAGVPAGLTLGQLGVTPGDIDLDGDGGADVATVAGDTLRDVAADINAAALGVTARVETIAVKPTAYSTPRTGAAVGAAIAVGGQQLDITNANGVTTNVVFGANQTAEQIAAAITAAGLNGGFRANVVQTGDGPDAAWVEITFDDGATPIVGGAGPGSIAGTALPTIGFAAANVTDAKEVLSLTRADGAVPVVADIAPGGTIADLGLTVVEGTSGAVIDTEDRVEVALKLLQDALQDFGPDTLTAIDSEVGVDLNRIEDVQARYNQFEIFHEEVQTEIENTDIPTAATQLSQSQLILESSFLAISKIQQLSLANFLR